EDVALNIEVAVHERLANCEIRRRQQHPRECSWPADDERESGVHAVWRTETSPVPEPHGEVAPVTHRLEQWTDGGCRAVHPRVRRRRGFGVRGRGGTAFCGLD